MSRRRRWRLSAAFVALGVCGSAAAACPDHLRFLGASCDQWQARVLPQALPPSRGNAAADSDAAAALGMRIFYDNRFSRQGSGVSCANCHDPEHAFAEPRPTSRAIAEVGRNAPGLLNAAWYRRSHFWDGKVDTLWSAPLFTLEQDGEMGSSRLGVVRTLGTIYKARYETVFGQMPDISDVRRFPAVGKPGLPAFDAMSIADRSAVNTVYANVGKALEAYVRKLAAGRSKFDDFLVGHPELLTDKAQKGMLAFDRHGCGSCHSGPNFTDEGFHDLHLATTPGRKDLARQGGIAIARSWQFTAESRFADRAATTPSAHGAIVDDPLGFRTPSLRNVRGTAPYGHNGAFPTLEKMIEAHAAVLPGGKAPTAGATQELVEFLTSLDGRPPRPPWNYWPGG